MESRGPEDSKNVKTSQAYFLEGFIIFFEDFSLTSCHCIVSLSVYVVYNSVFQTFRRSEFSRFVKSIFIFLFKRISEELWILQNRAARH